MILLPVQYGKDGKQLTLSIAVHTVFLTQIISRIMYNRFHVGKNGIRVGKCTFPNIQLKDVVNRLPPFKDLYDHTNRFLTG